MSEVERSLCEPHFPELIVTSNNDPNGTLEKRTLKERKTVTEYVAKRRDKSAPFLTRFQVVSSTCWETMLLFCMLHLRSCSSPNLP